MSTRFVILLRSSILLSIVLVLLFSLQLVVVNVIDRKGVESYARLNREIEDYSLEISRLEVEIAKESSLENVERRAKERGYFPAENIEYIR